VKSAQLSWSNRPIGGVAPAFNAKIWVEVGKDAVGGGLIRNIGGDRGDAQPGADGIKRCGAASNDRHPGAMRYERLDQS
jgi:hypothetical protein